MRMFVARLLSIAAIVIGCSGHVVAQMGMGWFSSAPEYSTHTLSTGHPGAVYTPFERLQEETRTVRSHAFPEGRQVEANGDQAAEAKKTEPNAEKFNTDISEIRETAFRCRTTVIHPQPNLVLCTKTYEPIYVFSNGPRERSIREALAKPAQKMEFLEAALWNVVQEVREKHGIEVRLDTRALEDAGVAPDVPVTGSITDMSLRAALRLLLNELDLTYVVRNEALTITTKDKASEELQLVLYPVPFSHGSELIIDQLTKFVAPTTWNSVGGPGAVQSTGPMLLVSQTEEIHVEVRTLLEQLFEAEFRGGRDWDPAAKPRLVTRIYPVADAKMLDDLVARLTGICNAALGSDGDPEAKVSAVGGRVVVQSVSRPFHIYAADTIAATNGLEVTVLESFVGAQQSQGLGGGGVVGGTF